MDAKVDTHWPDRCRTGNSCLIAPEDSDPLLMSVLSVLVYDVDALQAACPQCARRSSVWGS